MTEQSLMPNIPTLTNLNWVMWRISIEGYMKQHDLYSFILTTEVVPTDATKAKLFKTKQMKALGILQQYMRMTNYQRFKSKLTKDNLRVMWLKLESHYQLKEIANQAKVYNDFLGLRFKGTDMYQFISDLTGGQISNLCA
ncbi:hypothetical protein PCASD_03462 [Puccinia coronata f. sp. avenae]|uniref:Retrotransposon Copia-like N-terminal domain-containing protein n=1 Tax=Puccinia coronata f. sp. avenae TaxID=200324 RepID=A0A2N5V7S7_9BASI|nr:hypothetical protein PCASD_03462 [Puccinia coronata f. sp. avenae]